MKTQKVTFGEWARWTLARRGLDRSEVAAALKCNPKTVTNIYKRDVPDGISDVFLSRLASLLEMDELDLLVEWEKGLPKKNGRSAS